MANFVFKEQDLKGVYLIESFHSGDLRGGFAKTFEKDVFEEAGIAFSLNETFISKSTKNVIRGLHFQLHNPQAKLVSVINGKVWDVIVDLRPNSKTYKQWQGYELSAENHLSLYIPKGFAHGFLSLEDETVMLYQCNGKYDKNTDTGIRFDDPDIGIKWPTALESAIHSERDLKLLNLKEYEANPMEL